MNRFVVFLRGINVGGHKKMKMADLRSLLEKLGFTSVKTYIQSGNIVLNTTLTMQECEDEIGKGIHSTFGWDVPVLVRTPEEILNVLQTCPFTSERLESGYFTLLHSVPSEENIAAIMEYEFPGETFVYTDACICLHFEKGAATAKLNNNWFEQKLKVRATTRNYRTLRKLLEMSTDT